MEGGKVRLNREKVTSSSRLVRADDVLTIRMPRDVRVVRVRGFASRRASPSGAAALYEPMDGHDTGTGTAGDGTSSAAGG